MKIHQMIQKKRKELGLTQEQMANYLGVSTPAVNKWENGNSCPDIEMLCPLARLLKMDVNELLGFREELTKTEITEILRQVTDTVSEKGFEEGMKIASEAILEYPNCSQLIYNLALTMEGQAMIEGIELGEHAKTIHEWLVRCSRCEEVDVRNLALHMLASKCINNKKFEEAQSYIEKIQKQDGPDVDLLKVNILLGQEEANQAAELLERMIQKNIMSFQISILRLIDAELQTGNVEVSKELAKIWREVSSSLGVWKYSRFIGEFQVAVETRNVEDSLKYLTEMLQGIQTPARGKDSPLMYRICREFPESKENMTGKKFLPGLLKDLRNNPGYDFLRENEEFQKLLEETEDGK